MATPPRMSPPAATPSGQENPPVRANSGAVVETTLRGVEGRGWLTVPEWDVRTGGWLLGAVDVECGGVLVVLVGGVDVGGGVGAHEPSVLAHCLPAMW
jgi:hypothetical protein